MQGLQDPYQSNVYNVNNAQHKGSGHFRNKKERETKIRHRNIRDLYRGIRDFKKGYKLELI